MKHALGLAFFLFTICFLSSVAQNSSHFLSLHCSRGQGVFLFYVQKMRHLFLHQLVYLFVLSCSKDGEYFWPRYSQIDLFLVVSSHLKYDWLDVLETLSHPPLREAELLLATMALTLKVGPDSGVVADHESVQDVGGGVDRNLSQVLWRQLAVKLRKISVINPPLNWAVTTKAIRRQIFVCSRSAHDYQ